MQAAHAKAQRVVHALRADLDLLESGRDTSVGVQGVSHEPSAWRVAYTMMERFSIVAPRFSLSLCRSLPLCFSLSLDMFALRRSRVCVADDARPPLARSPGVGRA